MTLADKETTEMLDNDKMPQDGLSEEQIENESVEDTPDTTKSADAEVVTVEEDDVLDEPVSEIDSVRKELEHRTDRLQRQAAEFQNYRRRTEQEKSQMVLFGKAMVIQQLLDVFDDFYRSIEATQTTSENAKTSVGVAYDSLKSGVELAYQKLMDELKKMDVEPIESVGKPFDEHYHEAVMQQPVDEGEDIGVVLTELQRGYRMGDRVLRHAKVVVSTEGVKKNDA